MSFAQTSVDEALVTDMKVQVNFNVLFIYILYFSWNYQQNKYVNVNVIIHVYLWTKFKLKLFCLMYVENCNLIILILLNKDWLILIADLDLRKINHKLVI